MLIRSEASGIPRPSCDKKGPGTKDELLRRLTAIDAAQQDILNSAVMLHEFFYGAVPMEPASESEAAMKAPALFDEIFATLHVLARKQGETIRILGLIKNAL